MMIGRRHLLQLAAAFAACGSAGRSWAEDLRATNAFNARSSESALASLDLPTAEESSLIGIQAPDVAENGANVPVEVSVGLEDAERVLVLGDRNVFPLLADYRFAPGSLPWFELKVKLAESSHLRVYVLAHDRLYVAQRAVRVIVGGCLPG